MNRILLLLLMMATVYFSYAENEIEAENTLSSSYKGINIPLSGYRETHSGTKLVLTFEGEFPEEMRGAFEHAVKLWEEVLPPSLPINVTVRMDTLRGRDNVISKVKYYTHRFPVSDFYEYPLTAVKSILMMEYMNGHNISFYDDLSDSSPFLSER